LSNASEKEVEQKECAKRRFAFDVRRNRCKGYNVKYRQPVK